jgi:hypothetical protein
LRAREVVRRRAVDLRAVDLRAVDFRAVDLRAVDLRAVDFRAVDLRAVLGLARLAVERAAPALFARDAVDFLRVVDALRFVVARLRVPAFLRVLVLRAPVEREVRDDPPELAAAAEPLSSLHLPLITRCAASATASAIIDPNLVALDTMLVAACEAVSAASSPASRILRRAAGLALIAAAAAASPAASISLLIAALASLSTVIVFDFEDERFEVLLEALAIAFSPSVARKRHFSAVTVP